MLSFFLPPPPAKKESWDLKLFKKMPRAQTIATYNIAVAALTAYLYSQDDNPRISEYGPDFLIHCLNAWLSPSSSFWGVTAVSFFNLHRFAVISEQLLSCALECESSMPLAWQLVDGLNHLLNVFQGVDLVFGPAIREV